MHSFRFALFMFSALALAIGVARLSMPTPEVVLGDGGVLKNVILRNVTVTLSNGKNGLVENVTFEGDGAGILAAAP